MFKTAFRSFSPLRHERPPPRSGDEGATPPDDVAKADQSATDPSVEVISPTERALVDALDEPSLIVSGAVIVAANPSARRLLGGLIEGRDLRLAIRHPQALDRILAHQPAEIDVT